MSNEKHAWPKAIGQNSAQETRQFKPSVPLTPDMVRAGADVLCTADPDDPRQTACDVFKAMIDLWPGIWITTTAGGGGGSGDDR